jgi:predicted HAD superfamily hydrolase
MVIGHQSLQVDPAGARVLTLDVFDTCLLRQCGNSINVFDILEQELAHVGDLCKLSGGEAGFAKLRLRAERVASEKLKNVNKNSEITFNEIYAEFMSIANLSHDEVEHLKTLEMDLERRLSIPNFEILALAKQAQHQGLQVAFVSDMYLPKQFTAELLSVNGYDVVPSQVFVSSEYGATKRTGELYSIVSKALKIPLSEFVHVGDDLEADVNMARSCGMSAYYYEKLGDRMANDEAVNRGQTLNIVPGRPRSLALGIRDAILSHDYFKSIEVDDQPDFWFRLGYERAGILFLGYTLWLIDQCQQDQIDTLVFLACDGHIMKRCFDLVCAWKGIKIKSVYMYASRRALVFPSILSMDDDDITFLTGGLYHQPVKSYMDRCGLAPEVYERELVACGFQSSADKISSQYDFLRLYSLFKKLYMQVLLAASKESKLVVRYLDQIEIPFKGNIGLVDIGWCGSMQEAFEKFLQLTGRSCSVNGYYLGTHVESQRRVSNGQSMKGYLTTLGTPSDINQWIEQCVELLEFICFAPHGTCLGFDECEGTICPKLELAENENTIIQKATRVQDGVLYFFESCRKLIELCPHLDLAPRDAFLLYAETIMEPTREEAELLGSLTHVDSFGQSKLEYIANPNSSDSRVFWKAGYRKRLE